MSLPSHTFYEFGPFRLEPSERVLLRSGEPVLLPPKAFETLVLLVRNTGHVVSREELMKAIWPGTFVEENNLTQHVSLLRRTLGGSSEEHKYIETVPRLGYRFVMPVREAPVNVSTEFLLRRNTRTHIVLADSNSGQSKTKRRSWRTQALVAFAIAGSAFLVLLGFTRRPAPVPAVVGFAQLTHDGHFKHGPLITDGESVYFLEPENGRNRLMRIPATGGGPASVMEMPLAMSDLQDVSERRHELLVGERSATGQDPPLLSCSVPGGPCRRLNGVTAYAAAWSPRDDRIVYAQREKVFEAKSDGTHPRQLFAAAGRVLYLRPSPDGQTIRYLCEEKDAKTYQLWETRADGTQARLVFPHVQSDLSYNQGSWTPNAEYLFFTEAQGGRQVLWARRASQLFSDETRTPLNTALMSISAVAPAADGKRIFAIATFGRVEIVRYDTRSGSFTHFMSGVSTDGLAFSDTGDWVAYTTLPEGAHPGGILVRSRLDGTERLELTNPSQKAILPAWSPDGKRLAYMARTSSDPWNGPWKIYVVSSEGGASEELLPGTEDQGNPTWSRDGNSIIFAGVPWVKGFAPDSTAIHQMDLGTRKVTTLPGSQGLWSPRWSPDGRFLVAETADSRKLLLFDFSKHTWRPLAEVSPQIIGYTSWSHDSRFVFFNAYEGDQRAVLYRVDVLRQVTERFPLPESLRQPTLLGQWFSLAPDDAPLFLQDVSVRELFAFDLRLP
jgi:DNA-binding winged helix-turn-helix (wHTH) protein/Tol biopolymer transport system component